MLYYLNNERNEFERYNVSPEFFIRNSIEAILQPQPLADSAGTVPNPNKVITSEEFDFRMANSKKVRKQLFTGAPVIFDDYPPSKKETLKQRIPFLKKLSRMITSGLMAGQ